MTPFACCECGKDLTAEQVYMIGSSNYCSSHAHIYHPATAKRIDIDREKHTEYVRTQIN